MKNMLIVPLIFVSAALCVSCGSHRGYAAPEFKSHKTLNLEIVSDELMFTPWGILQYDSLLLVPGFSSESYNTLFVYDKNSGRKIAEGIKYGRGPGEVIDGFYNITLDGPEVGYHERSGLNNLSFSIDDFMEKGASMPYSQESVDLPKWCMYYREVPSDRFLSICSRGYLSTDSCAVRTVNLTGNDGTVFSYEGSPVHDPAESFVVYMQPFVTISPDCQKMAIATNRGAILETFDISEGLKNTATSLFLEPGVKITGNSSSRTDSSIYGFGALCSDDRYIYASYDGETSYGEIKNRRKESAPLLYRNVATFDWKGRPNVLYKTNYRVEYLCVSGGTTVYAVVRDLDGGNYIARAEL